MSDEVDLVPLLRQRLAQDMLPCTHDYWECLKLTPPGDEVADAVHAESHLRMNSVAHYQSFVDVLVVLTADILTEVMYHDLKKVLDLREMNAENAAEHWHDVYTVQNRENIRAAIYPILAHMLEAGVLRHGELP